MSQSNQLVSVVIPIYNTEKYLHNCLLSVVNQTYKNIEILLVNDGSVDSSLRICQDMARTDVRIKVFSQKNKGVSSARNLGIKKAAGDFIAFVDSDDTIDKSMIESLLNLINLNECDLAVCGICLVPEWDKPPVSPESGEVRVLSKGDALKDMLDEGIIANAPFGKLYRKDLIQKVKFPEGIAIGEDLHTNYYYLTNVERVAVENVPKYFYLQRTGSAMNQEFSQKRMHGLRVARDIYRDAQAHQSPVVQIAAQGRLMMEAIYIILMLSSTPKKYHSEYEICKKEIKKNARNLILSAGSSRRNRLYGSISLLNVGLLIRLLKAERRIRGKFGRRSDLKKVLIRHYSANNLGDDLFVKLLAERYKNQFSVILHTKENSLKDLSNVKLHKNKLMSVLTYYLDKTMLGRNAWLNLLSRKNDILVYVGGSIFMEGSRFKEWKFEKRFYSRLRVPCYIIGANFGPYTTPEFIPIVRSIISTSKDVCFRDKASYSLFKDCAPVRMASDIIFSLDISKYEVKADKVAVFSIIDCQDRLSSEAFDKYESEILKLTRKFIHEGYEVVYMSFCNIQGDDKAIDRILTRANKETSNHIAVHSYEGDINSALTLLARCEVVVGTRFHATILGLAFSKKVLPIIYSKKTNEVLKDIGFDAPKIDLTDIESIEDIDINQIKSFDVRKQVASAQQQFMELDKVLEVKA